MKFGCPLFALNLASLAFSLPLHAATVRGSVLGVGDKPIAGATVLLLSPDLKTPIKVQTGADGTWSAELPDPTAKAGAVNAPYEDMVGALVVAPGQGFEAKIGKQGDTFVIRLPPPTTIGGVVQDEKGAPLSGVELRLKGFYTSGFNNPGDQNQTKVPFDMMPGSPLGASGLPVLATKSDAQGKWNFGGIPQGMRVFLALADDRFSIPDVEVRAGTLDAVVKATAGAAIKGRVLLPDGKPAPGIQVFGRNEQNPKTDAEGRFVLSRLSPGETWVSLFDEKKEWLSSSKKVDALQAGETRDIGDITLSRGVRLTGRVVDDAGRGIGDAKVVVEGNNVDTEADGRFQMRVAPGKFSIMVSKPGFLTTSGSGDSEQTQVEIEVAAGETEHVVEPLKLQRGVYVAGTARDETGKPATGVELNAGSKWENPASAVVGKDGSFRFGPLWPGKEVTLHAADAWDLTTEVKLKAPTVAQETAAPKLTLTVKKIELAPVTGRIVSPDGLPVAGAGLQYRIYVNQERNSWSGGEIVSDDKGIVSFGQLRPEQSPDIDSLKSDKYVLVKTSTPKREGNRWNLGDIIVSPLDGQITGQVVTAAGAPVAGAQVAVAGRYPLKVVVSGADGSFRLDRLPRGEAILLAAKEHSFVRQAVKVGTGARLTLEERPVPKTANGEQLLRAITGGYSGALTARVVSPLDPDFALSILRKNGAGVPDPAAVAVLIAGLARRNPALAATWGLEQWQKLPAQNQTLESGTTLARALIPFNRDFAARWLQEAPTKIARNDFSAEAANQYFALAGLAGALGDTKADSWLDLGLTATDQSVLGAKRIEVADSWGRSVGTTAQLVDRLTREMEPQEQVRALAGAVETLASINLTDAQTLLVRLQTARQNPQVKAADVKQEAERRNGGNWQQTSTEVLTRAQTAVAVALAASPGTAALEMCQQISEGYPRSNALLKVARRHLKAGHAADATAALRAFAEGESYGDNSSSGAGIALSFDKTLASELFAKEYERLLGTESNHSGDYRPTVSSYAFYHAPLDAGESRLLLENEWEWRQTTKSRQDQDNAEQSEWQMRPLALAMGALDLPRALEMLSQLKDKYGQNGDVRWKIGLFLTTNGQIDLFNPGSDEEF